MSAYLNPDLMVIGDSLAQGVQSMSFSPPLAAQCVGARLSALQGWDFNIQTFARPVLYDLETEIRNITDLELLAATVFSHDIIEDLCQRINANLEQWMQQLVDQASPPAPPPAIPPFDNLAVGGSVIGDLLQPASYWRGVLNGNRTYKLNADDLLTAGGDGFQKISLLFRAINYAYVLNPSRDPKYEGFCAVDWLKERQPKRVLLSIGHNDGATNGSLWDIGFSAANHQVSINDLAGLDALAAALASLKVQWLCWDLLPKISAVANLAPVGDQWTGPGAGNPGNYCEAYQPVLSANGTRLTGDEMKQIDQSISTTNGLIKQKVTAAFQQAGNVGAIRFFDDFAFFQSFDFKNQPDNTDQDSALAAGLRVEFPFANLDQYIDNRYMFAAYIDLPNPPPEGGKVIPQVKKVVAGGIQSLDGMHPTGAGYMLKAIALSNQADLNLKPVPDPAPLLATAFGECTLTNDFPTVVNTLRLVLRGLQKISSVNSNNAEGPTKVTIQDDEHTHAQTWLGIMSSSMKPPVK